MTAALWRDPAGPLIRLATAFGLDPGKLPENESRRQLFYAPTDLDAETLRAAPRAELEEALRAAIEHYGDALTLQLKTADVIFKENWPIADLFKNLGDSPYFDALLKIDKDKLLSHWKLGDAAAANCLFLFAEPLIGNLQLPLTQLDDGGDALFQDDRKLLVFVPGRNVALDGNYLAIVGGDELERWQNRTTADPDAAVAVYAKAREKVTWVHFELKRITPLHLSVSGAAPPGDEIAAAVYAQLLACSFLYMARRSHSASLWLSLFESDASAVTLKIPDAKAIAAGGDPSVPAKVFAERAEWIYADLSQAGDRLTAVQHGIVDALKDTNPAMTYAELVRRAVDVDGRIDWAWQAFISGKLLTYFSQVKQLVETIDSAAKSYNEQVQTFTKTLIDNMLGAVAVIIGSFIASIFKSPFESYVFLFGTAVYALYLLIFPIGVGLSSTWQRFRESRADFQNRIAQFSKGIPPGQVEEIVGRTIAGREWWFAGWWSITAGLYLSVIIVLLAAVVVVPGRIKVWSDAFTLRNVAYGQPSGGVMPMTIRGESFDDQKQIVVRIGNAKYTNTDGGSLAVHGSTAITLAPRLDDVRKSRYVTVQQGDAGPAKLPLPACP